MGYGTGWAWFFGVLLAVGLVVLGVVAVRVIDGGVRRDGPGGGPPDTVGEARRLLDERYARGEITTEDYEQRRRVLGEGS